MKKKGISLLLALTLLLTSSCGSVAAGDRSEGEQAQGPISSPSPVTEEKTEAGQTLRGVWVATVYGLDYPQIAAEEPELLCAQADEILENCARMGMNAVFLQVRPSCDAIYPSQLFPWSRYLTGSSGLAPAEGFDPLAYWIDKAHSLGLELHAWINPFRVTRDGEEELAALCEDSPARLHPEWVVEHHGNYYLDPGIPEVRELVVEGAEELVRAYDLDGIHLDDYFYPGPDLDDGDTFARYGGDHSEVGDWRRENIDHLIRELDERLHAIDEELSFGVSPSGVWADKRSLPAGSDTTGGYESYFISFADSRKWVKEGWVDYICPQIYWYIGHSTMDYAVIARWWRDTVQGTDVKLYIGMADYKAGSQDEEDPWYGLGALKAQLALNRQLGVDGEIHFRYRFLAEEALTDLYMDWYELEAAGISPEAFGFLAGLPEEELGHWAARYYGELGALGIVTGRPDGSYAPDEPVERSSVAALVCRVLKRKEAKLSWKGWGRNYFPDTADTWAEREIGWLCYEGFLDQADYPDGFQQAMPMSRLEVVKLLVRSLGYRDDGSVGESRFPDVTEGRYYVEKACRLGLVLGKDDGTFGPGESITRGAAATLIWRYLNMEETGQNVNTSP